MELHEIYILFCVSLFFNFHVHKVGSDTAIVEVESHAPLSDGVMETDVLRQVRNGCIAVQS